MEKVYGSAIRQDGITQVGKNYYVYFGFGKDNESDETGYNYRHKFDHKPTQEEIREVIIEAINDETSQKILTGFKHEEKTVYLSVENQLNYAHLNSSVTASSSVTVKMSDSEGDDIFVDMTGAEFKAFYKKVLAFLNKCMQECWNNKKGLTLEDYSLE